MSLSRCISTSHKISSRIWATHVRSLAAQLPAPTFTEVKFVKEDAQQVMQELPEFSYYEMKDPVPNVYKGVAMDQSILLDAPVPQATAEPAMKFSKLENGLKIASIDRAGLTASLGLYVSAGSRFEKSEVAGVAHMVELMAYKSTAHLSNLRTVKTLEQLGAKASCTTGREVVSYKVEILREFLPIAVPLMVGNILFPRLLPWEVETAKKGVALANKHLQADTPRYLKELLTSTAFQNNTLGNKAICTDKSLRYFAPETIREYMLDHFSPERMVIVGVNVDHAQLSTWAMRAFAEYNAIPMKARPDQKATYTGGDCRVESDSPLAHLSFGFECGALGSADAAATQVLQALLGTGEGSVLSKAGLAASCSAQFFSDSGLFTIDGSAEAAQAGEYCASVAKIVSGLAPKSEEIARAKAIVKTAVFIDEEDAAVHVDQVGKQLLAGGSVVSAVELAKQVDAVTDAQVASVAKKIFGSKPTVVAYGDIFGVPHYSALESAFAGKALPTPKATKAA